MASGGGDSCGRLGWQSSRGNKMGGKMNSFNGRIYSLRSTNYLSGQIKGKSINGCDILSLLMCDGGGHCLFSPPAPRNLATSLCRSNSSVPKRRIRGV